MKNEEVFNEVVEDSVQTCLEIDDVYKSELGKLRQLYKCLTGEKPKALDVLTKCYLYTGSFPTDDSKNVLKDLLDNFGMLVKAYSLISSEDKIFGYLKAEHGIVVDLTDKPENAPIAKIKKFDRVWTELFPGEKYGKLNCSQIIKKILERTVSLQGSIVKDQEQIKVTNAEKVESECDVTKAHFMKSVQIKTKAKKKNEDLADMVSEVVSSAASEAAALQEVLENLE